MTDEAAPPTPSPAEPVVEPAAPPAAEPTPAAPASLADMIRKKLEEAKAPLKFADVKKGLKAPKKVSKDAFDVEIRTVLTDDVRSGRAFAYPSGKANEERYWSKDEKHALREEAVSLAEAPATLADLAKKLKPVSGADPSFVESLLRDLIGEEKLFEHPPKKAGGPPTFGHVAHVPPPKPHILDLPKNKKVVDKLVKDAKKLLEATGAVAEDLLQRLQAFLTGADVEQPPVEPTQVPAPQVEDVPSAVAPKAVVACDPADNGVATPPPTVSTEALEDEILRAIGNAPVKSLADLRRQMKPEYQGRVFDDAVLKLDDRQLIILHRDANPAKYSEAERAEFVADGGNLFTTISVRS